MRPERNYLYQFIQTIYSIDYENQKWHFYNNQIEKQIKINDYDYCSPDYFEDLQGW